MLSCGFFVLVLLIVKSIANDVYFNDDYIPVFERFPIDNPGDYDNITFSSNAMYELKPNIFADITKVNKLRVVNNNLEILQKNSFVKLSGLWILELFDNKLEYIFNGCFVDLTRMGVIGLQRNKLKKWSHKWFINCFNVIWIDLEDNDITHLDAEAFKPFVKLQTLKISRNKLERIDPNVFRGSYNFKTLAIQSNRLKYFDIGQAIKNFNGSTIDLTGNRLMYLPLIFDKSDAWLGQLGLWQNPIKCECFNGIVAWTKRTRVKVFGLFTSNSNNPICVYSSENDPECSSYYDEEAAFLFLKIATNTPIIR